MTNWELGTVVGSDGSDGVGIQSITKTGTSGLVDTYTITFTDGTTSTFTVTNGESATASIVTSWESTLSDEKVPSEKLTKNSIDGKADSVHTHTKSQITDFPTLATVATSGSYTDLSSKPSIPSASSDLSDGSDLIKKSNTSGLMKNDGTVDTVAKLTSSDIVDNLTTSDATKVLSAKQGKALNDLIGSAIAYINL